MYPGIFVDLSIWQESLKGKEGIKMDEREASLENYMGGWWDGCSQCSAWCDEINDAETDEKKQQIIDENLTHYAGVWLCEDCLNDVKAREEG